MQGIEFETDQTSNKYPASVMLKQSWMIRLLEKAGVTDRATANFVLLGLAIIFFCITIILYAGFFGVSEKRTIEQQQKDAELFNKATYRM